MINILRDLKAKVERMQEQILSIKKKKNAREKNTVTERIPLMGSLRNWTQQKKESELDAMSVETAKTENQNKTKPQKGRSKNCGTTAESFTYVWCNWNTKREKEAEEICEAIMTENFPK